MTKIPQDQKDQQKVVHFFSPVTVTLATVFSQHVSDML